MNFFSGRVTILILLVLLAAVILSICLLAAVPPVSRDALIHHLAVPKLYLAHGGIYEIPHLDFSYYTMNLDLMYLIPLYFNNDILPKYIHFAFALITAVMIYRYLSRRLGVQYALLGSLFFLTIPVIVRLSTTVYIDLGVVCFLLAAMIYHFHWIESGFRCKYLFFSALFCGLALGTKYNGLLGLFLLGLLGAFAYARYHTGQKHLTVRTVGWSTGFVLVALIVFSPWMIRNYIWTGNPVYPFYKHVFNAQPPLELENDGGESPSERSGRFTHIQVRRLIYGESWLEIALIPLRVFFEGKDDLPQHFDGRTNPFLLLLPLFAFWGIRSNSRQVKTEKWIMLFFSLFFLLYACVQTAVRIRYFSPIIPPLVILAIFGLHNLQLVFKDVSRRLCGRFPGLTGKIALGAILLIMFGWNGVYLAERFQKDDPLSYITGNVSRDEYIQARRPEYAVMQYANEHLGKNAKILGVFVGKRGYYADIDIEFSTRLLPRLAAESASAREMAEKLINRGFTHLLINIPYMNYWGQEYALQEKKRLQDFFSKHTKALFSRDGHSLLRITGAPEPAMSP